MRDHRLSFPAVLRPPPRVTEAAGGALPVSSTLRRRAVFRSVGRPCFARRSAKASSASSWKSGMRSLASWDGKSDILWRDTSGNVAIWEMNSTTSVERHQRQCRHLGDERHSDPKCIDVVRRERVRELVNSGPSVSSGMLVPPWPVRVLVAIKPIDFRNYAAPTIMRSWRREVTARRGFLIDLTPHNWSCARPCSAWPLACRARGIARA
jgi:hypothetical protein